MKKYDLGDVAACAAVIVSIVALLFTLHPNLNIFSSNHIEKAHAGSKKSQMLLANHYYEVGDYETSIYWYRIASASKGRHQATAYNNLAYLYARNYGVINEEGRNRYTEDVAIALFERAAYLGNAQGKQNLIILWNTTPKELFSIDYSKQVEGVIAELKKSNMVSFLETLEERWVYDGSVTSETPPLKPASRYRVYTCLPRN